MKITHFNTINNPMKREVMMKVVTFLKS